MWRYHWQRTIYSPTGVQSCPLDFSISASISIRASILVVSCNWNPYISLRILLFAFSLFVIPSPSPAHLLPSFVHLQLLDPRSKSPQCPTYSVTLFFAHMLRVCGWCAGGQCQHEEQSWCSVPAVREGDVQKFGIWVGEFDFGFLVDCVYTDTFCLESFGLLIVFDVWNIEYLVNAGISV